MIWPSFPRLRRTSVFLSILYRFHPTDASVHPPVFFCRLCPLQGNGSPLCGKRHSVRKQGWLLAPLRCQLHIKSPRLLWGRRGPRVFPASGRCFKIPGLSRKSVLFEIVVGAANDHIGQQQQANEVRDGHHAVQGVGDVPHQGAVLTCRLLSTKNNIQQYS